MINHKTLLLCIVLIGSLAASDYPTLQPGLNDFVGVVNASDAQSINNLCSVIRENTSIEIAVLIVNTTNGQAIADYSVNTAQQNGIGQKGKDNGVLMVIATQDRQWRIDVGYGLEGELSDGKVGTLARAYLVPALQQKQWGTGIYNTINQMGMSLGAIDDNQTSSPQTDSSSDSTASVLGLVIAIFIIILIAAFVFGDGASGFIGGGSFSGGSFGGSSGGGGGGGGGFGGGSFGGGGAGGSF